MLSGIRVNEPNNCVAFFNFCHLLLFVYFLLYFEIRFFFCCQSLLFYSLFSDCLHMRLIPDLSHYQSALDCPHLCSCPGVQLVLVSLCRIIVCCSSLVFVACLSSCCFFFPFHSMVFSCFRSVVSSFFLHLL